jgi:hypothetical protein
MLLSRGQNERPRTLRVLTFGGRERGCRRRLGSPKLLSLESGQETGSGI